MSKSSAKAQPDWLTSETLSRKPAKPMVKAALGQTSETVGESSPETTYVPSSTANSGEVANPVAGRSLLASVLERFASGNAGAKTPNRTRGWSPAAALAVATMGFLAVGFLWWFFPVGNASQNSGRTLGSSGGVSVGTSPVQPTGIAFGGLEVEEDKARLSTSDGLVWEGSVAAGEEGETITLSGPTAAQIKRGFELPGSSVQSGTYAIAEPDGRVVHVTFNTFRAGGSEVTQGSIFAIERDRLVHSGFYRDEREPGSEELLRTYMPPGDENYRVSFTAPEGTPVPLLVGFEELSNAPGDSQ